MLEALPFHSGDAGGRGTGEMGGACLQAGPRVGDLAAHYSLRKVGREFLGRACL